MNIRVRNFFSYTPLFLVFTFTSAMTFASDSNQANFQLDGIWAANLWSCKTAKRFVGFRDDKFALIDQLGNTKDIGLISSRDWASDGKAFEFRTDNETIVFQFDILGADHVVLNSVRREPENTDHTTQALKKLLNLQRCDPTSIKARILRERKNGS